VGKKEISCDCGSIHPERLELVRKAICKEDDLQKVCALYKLFADDTRLQILAALNCLEMCVCDLAVLLNMTKSAVSHQLKVLREHRLVTCRKIGKHSYYALADAHVKKLLDVALEHVNEPPAILESASPSGGVGA